METTLNEVRPDIEFIIKRNNTLQDEGDNAIAINLCSEAGIGNLI